MASETRRTRCEWPAVYGSRASTAALSVSIVSRSVASSSRDDSSEVVRSGLEVLVLRAEPRGRASHEEREDEPEDAEHDPDGEPDRPLRAPAIGARRRRRRRGRPRAAPTTRPSRRAQRRPDLDARCGAFPSDRRPAAMRIAGPDRVLEGRGSTGCAPDPVRAASSRRRDGHRARRRSARARPRERAPSGEAARAPRG